MIDAKLLEKSWPTRPRHALVIWGIIASVLSFTALLLLIIYNAAPNSFGFLQNFEVNFFGKVYIAADFVQTFGIMQLIVYFLLIIPFFVTMEMANSRWFYWAFAWIPIVLCILYILGWGCTYLTNIREAIPEGTRGGLITGFHAISFIHASVLLVLSVLAALYDITYPIKYKQIYHQYQHALTIAKEGKESVTVPDVKKNFYRYYKKRQWDEMLVLLYRDVLTRAPNEPLSDDELAFLIWHTKKADAKIRKAEFDYIYHKPDFSMLHAIHDRLEGQAQLKDIGERKFKEDKALMEYAQGKKPVAASTPAPMPVAAPKPVAPSPAPAAAPKPAAPAAAPAPVAQPSPTPAAPATPTPVVKPKPKPAVPPIGEAWKDDEGK